MAKPFGYGSIAMKTDRVVLREVLVDSETRMITEVEKTVSADTSDRVFGTSLSCDANMKNFRMMTAFDAVKNENVTYPRLSNDPDEEGFNWFVNNHKDRKGSGMSRSLNDVIFMKHLEAMNPKVMSTGAWIQERRNGGKGKRR